MSKHVLFIQGGGGAEGHAADAHLVASLKKELGKNYIVHYPLLLNDSSADYGRKKQIGEQIALIKGDTILAGHSLGASMILKYLSESGVQKNIPGVLLIATPFWQGEEEWKQALKLNEDFASKLPGGLPVFLYHSKDDEEVPFQNLALYAQKLPNATIREITHGGHQLSDGLSIVARDIETL